MRASVLVQGCIVFALEIQSDQAIYMLVAVVQAEVLAISTKVQCSVVMSMSDQLRAAISIQARAVLASALSIPVGVVDHGAVSAAVAQRAVARVD